jgi:polygalacturonase
MRRRFLFLFIVALPIMVFAIQKKKPVEVKELFPDGTSIPTWFRSIEPTDISKLGKQYRLTDFGVVNDSNIIQTKEIQSVIDRASGEGGGVIVIPKGTFLSGSLFFKTKTHLYLEEGAVLKGSDDISNFPIKTTRIEGQTLKYFTALVNVDSLDGFTISGKGAIDGNGLRYWRSFWLRRQWNPQCTNMDEMRPRLLYVSNSKNIQISGVHLRNSPFWTTHFYKCEKVKLLDLKITSPASPVKAPSTDAVDIDVCNDMLIKNCYMSVNDDAIALKGGKGPFADTDPNNGGNRNIIIENCEFGFCHSAVTCGSESVHNHNIVFRNSIVRNAQRLLWLKMRPDTPQKYEFIEVNNIIGDARSMIYIKPWTQFFDLKGEKDIKTSSANNITMKNLKFDCNVMFDIDKSEQYKLTDFIFENLDVTAKSKFEISTEQIPNLVMKNVKINGNTLLTGK